jgi:GNAT superfamily N-acetyltransferase
VVGAFGLSRGEHAGFWEIGRLVLKPDFNGANLGSQLISQSIKQLRRIAKVRAIITYAEAPRHTGAVYVASGFVYYGLSAAKNDFYVFGKKQERGKTTGVVGGEWRPRPIKHRFMRVLDASLNVKWQRISHKNRDLVNIF